MNTPEHTRQRVIGLLGGMSWESTAEYYRLANELVRGRLGGLHSARIVLASVDFAEIEALQVTGEWERAGDLLAAEAAALEAAGADMLLLCTNTMHKVADQSGVERVREALEDEPLRLVQRDADDVLGEHVDRHVPPPPLMCSCAQQV